MHTIKVLLSAMATMAMVGCGAEDPVSVSSSQEEDGSLQVAKLTISGGTAGGSPFFDPHRQEGWKEQLTQEA